MVHEENNFDEETCIFCLIASGKVPCKKVYEDENYLAILDIYPASKGHTLLFPKKHIKSVSEFPQEIFSIAKNISSVLKQISKGVNLFIAEGEIAGQKTEHMVIHLIPRYLNDKINLTWQPQKVSEEELEKIQKEIISKIIIPKKEPIKIQKEKLEEENLDGLAPDYDEREP